jgi:hypothetical protein
MIHLLKEAIEMEIGTMLQEFIGPKKHQVGDSSHKGWIHD